MMNDGPGEEHGLCSYVVVVLSHLLTGLASTMDGLGLGDSETLGEEGGGDYLVNGKDGAVFQVVLQVEGLGGFIACGNT